ncbi:MAG: ribbon-helix-helix protein, CopG family [Deltaproteobacteria bacterium]|nr:ribbon-helix-helix protein, CopG family [Deltaproteobacteria bacterium]
MAQTRRAQILMEPGEYGRLEKLARQSGVSVAELIRRAIKEQYFAGSTTAPKAARRICSMNLPVIEWDEAEKDIAEGHNGALP